MNLLMAFSAARDCSYKDNRALLTWPVKRSVGVGEVEEGLETREVSDGFGFGIREP